MRKNKGTSPLKTLATLLVLPTILLFTACPKNSNKSNPTPVPSKVLDNVEFDGDKFAADTPTPNPTATPSPSPSATPGIATFELTGPVNIVTNSVENYSVVVNAVPEGTTASFTLTVPIEFSITNITADIGTITFNDNVLVWEGEIGATPANLGFSLEVNAAGEYTLNPLVQPGGATIPLILTVTDAITGFNVNATNPTFAAGTNATLVVTLTNTGPTEEAITDISIPSHITVVSVSGAGSNTIFENVITWTVTPDEIGEALTIELTSDTPAIYEIPISGSPNISGNATVTVTAPIIIEEATFTITGPTSIVKGSPENYDVIISGEPEGTTVTFTMIIPVEFDISNLSADYGDIAFMGNTVTWTGEIAAVPANIAFSLQANVAGDYTLAPEVEPGSNTETLEIQVID